ncbi:MAG TPA: PHP domain-containing protein, partial [Gemmatimonadaceae bacterium]
MTELLGTRNSEPGTRKVSNYVELHCHSAFSLLDGAALPEKLIERAAELGYPALALTDHDDLGGAIRFGDAAAEVGIKAIIGAELTVSAAGPDRRSAENHHIVLLAENREGYGSLSTLITLARSRTRGEPCIDLDTLASHAKGLFALTDHDDLGGAIRFGDAATEVGIKAIIGAELTCSAAARTRRAFGAVRE